MGACTCLSSNPKNKKPKNDEQKPEHDRKKNSIGNNVGKVPVAKPSVGEGQVPVAGEGRIPPAADEGIVPAAGEGTVPPAGEGLVATAQIVEGQGAQIEDSNKIASEQ